MKHAWVILALAAACAPPKPQLKDLKSIRLSTKRQGVGPVVTAFSWDTNLVLCDSIPNLKGSIDGEEVPTFAGQFLQDRIDDSGVCQVPNFQLTSVEPGPHTLAFSDGTAKVSMTVSLLESGGAVALTPMPDDLPAGSEVAWSFTLPTALVSSWKIQFRDFFVWGEGVAPVTEARATVPSQPDPMLRTGKLSLDWRVAAVVTDCQLAQECRADVTGLAEREVRLAP